MQGYTKQDFIPDLYGLIYAWALPLLGCLPQACVPVHRSPLSIDLDPLHQEWASATHSMPHPIDGEAEVKPRQEQRALNYTSSHSYPAGGKPHPAGLSRTMLTVLFLLQVLTWTGELFFRDRFLRGRTKRSDNKDGKESLGQEVLHMLRLRSSKFIK